MIISNRNPTPYFDAEAIGFEKACNDIAQTLSTLPWLAYSFGKAFHLSNESEKLQNAPFAYLGSKEYYPLLPNDSLKSFSFIVGNGNEEIQDYNENSVSTIYERDSSIIIWGNFRKINGPDDKDYSIDILKRDVIKLLKKQRTIIQVDSIDDQNVETVFNPFDVSLYENALYFPFFAFRVNVRFSYIDQSCLNS